MLVESKACSHARKSYSFLALLIIITAVALLGCAAVPPPAEQLTAPEIDKDFLEAVKGGNFPEVKSLLSKGADVNARADDSSTALMVASAHGHRDVVGLLLKKGADVNARTNSGATALMVASVHGYLKIVKLLITNGADVNARMKGGVTAIKAASRNGHSDVVELLRQCGATDR